MILFPSGYYYLPNLLVAFLCHPRLFGFTFGLELRLEVGDDGVEDPNLLLRHGSHGYSLVTICIFLKQFAYRWAVFSTTLPSSHTHCKKRLTVFASLAGMSLTKLSLAMTGKQLTFFYSTLPIVSVHHFLNSFAMSRPARTTHCKDTLLKIRNTYSQKWHCTACVPFVPLFQLTRAIMILVKSQTGSDHTSPSYFPFSPTLPPDKSNNDSVKEPDRK